MLEQAASSNPMAPQETSKLRGELQSKLRRVNDMGNGMWVLIIEILMAFFLLVFIVWWTMYSGVDHATPDEPVQADAKDEPLR